MNNQQLINLSDKQRFDHRCKVAERAEEIRTAKPSLTVAQATALAESECDGRRAKNLSTAAFGIFSEATASDPARVTGVPVFREGEYPQGKYTAADVRALASNYDPEFLEAPLTPDHRQEGESWGWWSRFFAMQTPNGMELFGDVNLNALGETMWKGGFYKRRSIEIYTQLQLRNGTKGMYPKAVSLLGAASPAVKGMKNMFTVLPFDGVHAFATRTKGEREYLADRAARFARQMTVCLAYEANVAEMD